MKKNLLNLVYITIAALTIISCQKDELSDQVVVNTKNQKTGLPAEIHIISATQLPEGATLTARSATTNVTVNDVAGKYLGLLHNVVMNGNAKDDVSQLPIQITQGVTDNTFDFYLPPFQVGNMPGKLSIDIDGLTLKSDGTFDANINNDKQKNLLTEKVLLEKPWYTGGNQRFDVTLIDGSFTPVSGGYHLNLTLESEGSIWFIKIFKAHVEYDGDQQ